MLKWVVYAVLATLLHLEVPNTPLVLLPFLFPKEMPQVVTAQPAYQRVFSSVFFVKSSLLATSFDFQIVTSNIPGVSQIIPQNEDAYSYLVEETMFTVFKDGTTALFDERVGDFISDAGHAHLCCAMS